MPRPITLVAAMGDDGQIGLNGAVPWQSPEDMKHFVSTTKWHPVLMGRKTWESLRGPLPHRPNFVLSANTQWWTERATVVRSVEAALEATAKCDRELMVIGGAAVYALFLPIATRLVLSLVPYDGPADTHFPLRPGRWRETRRIESAATGIIYQELIRAE